MISGEAEGPERQGTRARARVLMVVCKWTNWAGGNSQGVLFFRVAEFMSVSFLYSFAFFLVEHGLFFSLSF